MVSEEAATVGKPIDSLCGCLIPDTLAVSLAEIASLYPRGMLDSVQPPSTTSRCPVT